MKKILLTAVAVIIASAHIIAGNNRFFLENDFLLDAMLTDTPENIVGKNYVGNTVYTVAGGNIANSCTTTEYMDGLGRSIQKVSKGFTAGRNDLVTLTEYNNVGLPTKTWLPMQRAGATGTYMPVTNYKSLSYAYYNDGRTFVETKYELSPSRRVVSVANPGNALYGHEATKAYKTNLSGDIKRIYIGDNGTFMEFSGVYPSRELYVTESQNEDGCQELIYTDKEGKKILARTMNGTEKIDTYFVYDFAGRLAVVITPEGTNEAIKQNLKSVTLISIFVNTYCYRYRYDSQGNLVEKQVPGGFHEEMNYDSYGRLWRRWRGPENSYWNEKYLEQYTYDALNRIQNVSILVMPISANITSSTYTRGPVLMSSYIYDNYKGVPATLNESTNTAFVAAPRGSKTYEKLLVLESNTQIGVMTNYTERAFYYDKEGRLKRTIELNHRGGRSTIDYEYDFRGNTLRRTERIQPMSNASADVLDVRYTYDHVGRMLTQTSTLNTSDPVTVTYSYNELGELKRKNINGLIMDYTYNLQGWLTSQDSPYYSAKLKYYDSTNPSYSGNITEWEWGGAGTWPHTYKYKYDKLSRMTEARYSGEAADKYSEQGITYDRNGNILTMTRGTSDRLTYTYDGDKVQTINSKNFVYDNCGNMTKDERNDLNITYNFLNLPWLVTRISNQNDRVMYSYLSDGTKFSALDQTGYGVFYVGSLVYKGGPGSVQLESAGFGDGRFWKNSSSQGPAYAPEYYLQDHLGSPRALCDYTGELKSLRDYYAFGKAWTKPHAPAASDPYRYNGKEQQAIAGAGLLDYGARFYNPDIARWMTIDPLAEKLCNISPYAYCAGSPVNAIDWQGKLPIFINGFTILPSEKGTQAYWNGSFMTYMPKLMGDFTPPLFRHGGNSILAGDRFKNGFKQGMADFDMILKAITDSDGNITETVKVFTHSMGAAYGKGYVKALATSLELAGYDSSKVIEIIFDFDPYQAGQLTAHSKIPTIQITHIGGIADQKQQLQSNKDFYIESNVEKSHSIGTFYRDFIAFLNQYSNMEPGEYEYDRGGFHKKD